MDETDRPDAAGSEVEESDGLPVISTRAAIRTAVVIVILVVGIYFLLPRLAGFGDAIGMLGSANPVYVAVAFGFAVLSFATYIALFRAVVGGEAFPITWAEAYEINMAGFAATLLFSAGGAGGVVLTWWALRQGGMERRDVGTRMIAFIVLHYLFYPLAIVVFGILLRTGVLHGGTLVSLTVVPAAIAGVVMILGLALALVPADIERRIRYLADRLPWAGFLARLAPVPAMIADGVRAALRLVAHPSRAGLAVVGAIGFWAANIGILWASFKCFGIAVPFGVVVMGFFLGMVANLIPFVPAGVGAVDAGMIGVFVLFGFPEAEVFAAILIYRLMAFWLPIPPGVAAFFQLRKRVRFWKSDGLPVDRAPRPGGGFIEIGS
ncbi:MAG: flippase-like domain-containing protein [Solirubrobacterales bacterium]|nr:flippase-like domain-containing protein [Solirubrobacterales bacterium]